ncbi:protein phosphatase 1 regulatory subunit 3D isoform X1 [Anguilla anguilla]|uniref:protein phosphatase 1 regulatory subunit 3D isoform X1 n=1 Tax=Anguilla anguilla TaxID=7936 RepID=UPI0015B18042|nr:protein phosphatase 1 regulatory subunit 3D isoform X1 [Anguilla anguilla]
MAKGGGWWQEKSLPGKSGIELANTSGLSTVSRPPVTIRLGEILKPEAERKPVKIRPPSPRTPPPREAVFGRSLSVEPTPKPIIRRRAQSLPSTREQRRRSTRMQVRFVDSLGLDLEDVKVFKAGEDPLVPQHVISRLLMNSELASGKHLEISLPYFKPAFPENLGEQPNFLNILCRQQVCLERVLCSELGITGTAQVLNLAFEKEVMVHYSFTNWRSKGDSKASWVSSVVRNRMAGEPDSDIFRFRLPVPPFILQPGALLEFAICFQVEGSEFWDNNNGQNYKLTCHSYKLTVPRECEDSMVHFI